MKNVIVALVLLAAFPSLGELSRKEISAKTDSELVVLLTNKDSSVRCISLTVLELRFENPDTPTLITGLRLQGPHPLGVPLPAGLLEETASLATNDSDFRVRLAAVSALCSFKSRTNTTPVLTAVLDAEPCIVRIRAAKALIRFTDEYHEPISTNVVQTLVGCLNPKNSPDDLWQAAAALGSLGKRATEALPFLEKLKKHESPQVRAYAKEAISRIQKESSRNSESPNTTN